MKSANVLRPNIKIGLGLLFGNGAAAYLSRLLGRGDKDTANKVASTAIYSGVSIGAIVILFSVIFLEPILKQAGAIESVMSYAITYPIVNFCGTGMTDGATVWSTAEYCSRIAGALAGTPMKISATYCPLPELTDCTHMSREEADKAVGDGKLVLRWDGRQVKLNRAVNSLITTSQGMLDSFKKIKLVEIMDLIRTDISQTCEDDYVGKFANSYDNKMLLITAIRGYLMGLARDSLIKTGYTVELDTEAISEYLTSRGTDTEGWDTQRLKEADTGSHVFILVRCKILDAIEDIIIRVEI